MDKKKEKKEQSESTGLLKEAAMQDYLNREEFSYNPDTCQLGYNDESNEFRVFDDNAGHWFKIRCSASPDTEGQIIKATLNYTTKDDNKSLRDVEMTVKKISRDGRIWLWSDSRSIGVVVKRL